MRLTVVSLVLILAALGLPTEAQELCSYDRNPAATLLLPYFEVDLDDPNGRTTLLSVATSSFESTLVHLTIWTDLGVPTIDFPIFLTGYDVQTINLRDLIAEGRLPVTGFTVGEPGAFSEPGSDFPGCDGILPLPDELPASFLADLRSALTGGPGAIFFAGRCGGFDHGDSVARGFITLDVATRCDVMNAREEGYFGPDGVAGYDNVLWGDYYYVDSREGFAQGESLVRIHADADAFQPGMPTFYGRHVGHDGSDGREPLPSEWGARYAQGGPFTGGTDFVAWAGSIEEPESFPCGSPPPARETQVGYICAFDEEENPDCFDYCGIIDPPPPYCPATRGFPLEANRVTVGGEKIPAPWDFGWLYVNFNEFIGGPAIRQRQSWVTALVSAEGRFSVGLDAVPFDTGCSPSIGPPWLAFPF